MTHVSRREVAVFIRLFATMIEAGLPLVPSLNILVRQTANKSLREVIRKVVIDVQSGDTLAEALRRHPKVFPELSVNMVAAGEAAGALGYDPGAPLGYLEKEQRPGRKVRAAMMFIPR